MIYQIIQHYLDHDETNVRDGINIFCSSPAISNKKSPAPQASSSKPKFSFENHPKKNSS